MGFFFGVYYGIQLLAALTGFVFAASFRDRTYLWFALMVLMATLETWAHRSAWVVVGNLAPLLGIMAGQQFARSFLSMRARMPLFDRASHAMIVMAFILIAPILLLGSSPVSTALRNFAIATTALVALSYSVRAVYLNIPSSVLYLATQSLPFVVIGVTHVTVAKLARPSLVTLLAIPTAQVVAITVLCFGLFGRIRRLQSQKLADSLQEVENRHLKTLLHVLSHDVEQPLRSIEAEADQAAAALREERSISPYMHRIATAADLVRDVLSDVRSMMSALDGKTAPVAQVVSLMEVVAKLRAIYARSLDEKHLELRIDTESLAGRVVLADPTALASSIVGNVLSNAIKFSPQGGTICVRAGDESGQTFFEIIDQSTEMPVELRARLCDVAASSVPTDKEDERSLGYGMPLVQALMELYRGRVEVVEIKPGINNEARATAVRLWFPAARHKSARGIAPCAMQ